MRRKKDKNWGAIFIVLFIVLIMTSSILGFIHGSYSTPKVTSEGIKFTNVANGWRATIDGKVYTFSNLPRDVKNLQIPDTINFNNQFQIDITYDPDSEDTDAILSAISEMIEILGQNNIYIRQGLTQITEFNVPLFTCLGATTSVPVIYYKTSNTTQLTHVNNCIIIESQSAHSYLLYTDLLIYKYLGIL